MSQPTPMPDTPATTPTTPTVTPMPDAIRAWFREQGAIGGHTRAARMTPEARKASAEKAARAPRRGKRKS